MMGTKNKGPVNCLLQNLTGLTGQESHSYVVTLLPPHLKPLLLYVCYGSTRLGTVAALFPECAEAFGTQFVFFCCAVCAGLGIILTVPQLDVVDP